MAGFFLVFLLERLLLGWTLRFYIPSFLEYFLLVSVLW